MRNGAADPFVGPLGEGAGKMNVGRALAALRDGVVVYSAASGSGQDAGTGPRDLQGSWQIGAIQAGVTRTQRFVVHAAPGAPRPRFASSSCLGIRPTGPGDPLAAAWSVNLPSGSTSVRSGRDEVVTFKISVPASAGPGMYSGTVVARVSNGQTLHVPVFASVALHDPNTAVG